MIRKNIILGAGKKFVNVLTEGSDSKKPISKSNNGPTKPPLPDYGENTVVNHPKLVNASIVFKGRNNILYCENQDITISHCRLAFQGDNSVIYISNGRRNTYSLDTQIFNNSSVYIGKNNHFNATKSFIYASEEKNIIIGDECLVSFNCWLRTSDSHAVYDSQSKKRLNPSKSVLIGDHVWLGQNVTILKGARVGSGAIVGASSVVAGKTLKSNTSYAGNPVRAIKEDIYFAGEVTDDYKSSEVGKSMLDDTDEWIYSFDPTSALALEGIDKGLSAAKTSKAKLAYMKKHLANNKDKNRFYISEISSSLKS